MRIQNGDSGMKNNTKKKTAFNSMRLDRASLATVRILSILTSFLSSSSNSSTFRHGLHAQKMRRKNHARCSKNVSGVDSFLKDFSPQAFFVPLETYGSESSLLTALSNGSLAFSAASLYSICAPPMSLQTLWSFWASSCRNSE